VFAGINPTYQQLVAAARSGTQGLQVWVQAAVYLGYRLQGNSSTAFGIACTVERQQLQDRLQQYLQQTQWPALAGVMFSGKLLVQPLASAGAAAEAELQQRLSAMQLTPAALHDLLLVALSMAPSWCGSIYMDPLSLLADALLNAGVCGARGLTEQRAVLQEWRQQQQAALQVLQPAAKQQLVDLALLRGHTVFLRAAEELLGWQAAPAAAMTALQKQIEFGNAGVIREIASWARYRVNAQQAAQLMLSAVLQGRCEVVAALFSLAAAPRTNAEQLATLFTAAVETRNTEMIILLANKVKARQVRLPRPAMIGWLQQLVQRNDAKAVAALFAMEAAEKLNATALAPLFQQAMVQQQTATAAPLLIWLAEDVAYLQQLQRTNRSPSLDTAAVVAFLQAAMQQNCSSMAQVCKSNAVAELLPADALVSLLQLAIEQRASSATIAALCSCGLGQKMLPDQAVGLLLHALQCGNTAALQTLFAKKQEINFLQYLSEASNAQQLLQVAAAAGLLHGASSGSSAAVHWVSALWRALQHIPQPQVEQALQLELMQSGYSSPVFQDLLEFTEHSVNQICRHMCGGSAEARAHQRQQEAHALARLAATAVQLGDVTAVIGLCQRPAAQRIAEELIAQLLQLILVQQQWQQRQGRQQQEQWQLQLRALRAVLVLPGAEALHRLPDVVHALMQQAVQLLLPLQVTKELCRGLKVVDCLSADVAAALVQLAGSLEAADDWREALKHELHFT
jgi:hypothetical protein